MAKRSLPESLELLLDTMCNTFGGVMFIAISMVITLMVSRQLERPKDRREEDKRRIEACKQENIRLTERLREEEARLARVKDEAGREVPDNTADLSAAVAGLEQELKVLNRKREHLAGSIRILKAQLERLKNGNDRLKEELEKNSRELSRRRERLSAENRRLTNELDVLRETLANTPVKRLNFPRSRKTTKTPYILIVKNGRLHRAGAWPLRHDTPDVAVKRTGHACFMTPRNGEHLAAVDGDRFRQLCDDFSPDSHYLWIMVDGGSLSAFVPFRRMLRSLGCMVKWYVNENNIVYVGDGEYYASY